MLMPDDNYVLSSEDNKQPCDIENKKFTAWLQPYWHAATNTKLASIYWCRKC